MPSRGPYKRRRKHRCKLVGCPRFALKPGGYCSRSCNRRAYLAALTPEQRRQDAIRIRAMKHTQEINRMLQRVKVMADSEDARIVMAWRYGKNCAKSQRYRLAHRQTEQGAAA